ncbi:hypothetical protein SAMN04489761_2246 [Tenacibaculum sp. MAR_2009_124]|uniref:hypothetical protein n=1 Tax=Tenacibaculum sp. MAR_2009_124 TaxID=1250059 RepID=UPI000899FB33|nr:hypothetical protein [Tenacibaculum sp. MAR_2009_124]SEC01166.1 hypothetical protein SAMN04489761_2246 [Tenacibaculum sp. MAR_2009_124]
MRKLKLDNFRVTTLTNLHSIRGGNMGGDIETGDLECVNMSTKFIEKGNGAKSISQ